MIDILNKLEKCLEKYFSIFIEYYPDALSMKDSRDFAPGDLYQLTIEAHCLTAILGKSCVERLNYVGFDEYISFDNPVDWYNWAAKVRELKIPKEVYLSISIRIDSELKRIRFLIENEQFNSYENLKYSNYLKPKERYKEFRNSLTAEGDPKKVISDVDYTHTNIMTSTEQCKQSTTVDSVDNKGSEQEAINNLDRLHKKNSIITSWLAILSKLIGS